MLMLLSKNPIKSLATFEALPYHIFQLDQDPTNKKQPKQCLSSVAGPENKQTNSNIFQVEEGKKILSFLHSLSPDTYVNIMEQVCNTNSWILGR